MIAIVDYGSGNIKAIANIYKSLNVPTCVAKTPEDLADADKIILPGVGSFDQAMAHLNASGLREPLTRRVREERVPLLGICVGMQLLARHSEEGDCAGLAWIDAEVKRFDERRFSHQTHLPHMGWNDLDVTRSHPLLSGLDAASGFYFLHSYYFACDRRADVLAQTEYGTGFDCAVNVDNVSGVQFHPEKSHHNGVQLLKNFADM